MQPGNRVVVDRERLDTLFETLRGRGYEVVGPTLRDGAIIYDSVRGSDELPVGWMDEQGAGRYRLKRRSDAALFGYTLPLHSWKRFLLPPMLTRFKARRAGTGFEILGDNGDAPRYAFLGVRACELEAIAIQDRVLFGGAYADADYKRRRQSAFLVAVNCGQAGGTCFCASVATGPRVAAGHDLALTEILEGGHRFVVEVGSPRGAEVATALPWRAPSEEDLAAAEAVTRRAEGQMGRKLETDGLKELLYANYESAHWDDVSKRCMSCTNCTMACPTCFCSSVEDRSDLVGAEAERRRRWDSCFTLDFSYIHGGSVRTTAGARYRQWITHKLATWQDQFGSLGCVGCGRCITWCPVGIDITEEVGALRGGAAMDRQAGR